jgi:L-2,4-diaminobutyric acid acetyltransferase
MSLNLTLRPPTDRDGMAVHQLIAACPPLDTNSAYCNLIQCAHFAETSVLAEVAGELVGFISGHRIPARPDTLFVWQVAVSNKGRGQGLAGSMLAAILDRPGNQDIRHLETTVTADNAASWALFESFARKRDAELKRSVMFDREQHFAGTHDTEMLARIGPFRQPVLRAVAR